MGYDLTDELEQARNDEVIRLRHENECLCQVLSEALDVFRRHECKRDHMVGECHLCEIVHEGDAAIHRLNRD